MDFRRISLALVLALTATTVGAAPSWSGTPSRVAKPGRVASPTRAQGLDNQRRIDVNNVNMFVTNFGSFAYDLSTGNSGLIYPKGTTNTAVFAAGIWLGATVSGQRRTVVAEYSQEFGPGIMLPGGGFDNASNPNYKVYKVARFSGDPSDTAHVNRTADELEADPVADPLVHHAWSEYMAGAAPYGAPTRTYRLPVTDTADPSDSVDVLGPDVLGDQMLWAVYNDADPSRHTNDAGGSTPLGVEIQQTSFAFNRQGPLGNTTFTKYIIINKGTNTLQNMYVSQWSDPDLGGASDDLVGSDVPLSLGYVYNANNNDQLYGSAPPVVGFDFFLGPTDALGDTLPLTSFNKYINGTDPASTDETYNYMQGLLPDGSDVIDPTTGLVTTFFHPGDPVVGTGWLDTNPSDRRLMLSSGPFTMAPGDTQTVVVGVIVGQGNDRLSSISALRFFDTFAQDAFDRNFVLPSPPQQPQVDVTVDHGTVTLCWDAASRTNFSQPGYAFEGYNVYQGETVAGPWKRIATYDEINAVRVIFDEVFDLETGQLLPAFPVAFGSDAGVQFCHTQTTDAVRGGPLNDGTEYYFAVTAYAYGPSERPKVLENAQQVIRVTPQRPAGGTDPSTASALDVIYLQKDPTKAPATDVVTVQVVNPSLVTGHTYKVTFEPRIPPFEGVVGSDTATVTWTWTLTDSTTGQVLFTDQLNKRGDSDYRVVDGLQVVVSGAYFPAFQDAVYLNNDATHRRAFAGVSAGLEYFGGGAGLGDTFFGSSINPVANPDSFKTVEIQFDAQGTSKAYRYLRLQLADGTAPPGGREYRYAGFVDVPFRMMDVTNNVQIDAAFVEKAVVDASGTLQPTGQPASFDSTWALLPDDLDLGNREYLFSLNTPYSDTPKAVYETDGFIVSGTAPLLYALWAHLRAASDVIDPGDVFRYVWANPATANDVYVFDTTPIVRGNATLAKGNIDRVRVVPNPYYNRSRYETSQFNRVVRFINLPEVATIRIFNLSGKLVRTLQKTDNTSSQLDWDIQTENQLPVASGVYIYHVDAPGVGSTKGRLVVFMEKERLNNF